MTNPTHNQSPAVSEREALERIASMQPRPEQDEGEPGQRCQHCGYRRKLTEPMQHWEHCAYQIASAALARLAHTAPEVGLREALARAAEIETKPMEAHAFRHLARYATDGAIAALAQPEAARVGGLREAIEALQDGLADLEGEHEVMCGRAIDRNAWSLDVKVTHIDALLAALATQPARNCSFCNNPATTDVSDDSDPLMPACAACYAAWQLDPGFTANDATQPAAGSEGS